MSRQSRILSQSGIYHVLFQGINKQMIFIDNSDYNKFLEILSQLKEEMHFEIYAYCLMSNHAHLIIREENELDISLIMKRLLTKYVHIFNVKYDRTGALVANRYKSIPVEVDDYFLNLIRYIHQNPIKAGLTKKVGQYQFDSYKEYITTPTITDTEMVYSLIDSDTFTAFHNEKETIEFTVSSRKKKTDNELAFFIMKNYKISNPTQISKLNKDDRDRIILELKDRFSMRQIQRVTGLSRGITQRIVPKEDRPQLSCQKRTVPNCHIKGHKLGYYRCFAYTLTGQIITRKVGKSF